MPFEPTTQAMSMPARRYSHAVQFVPSPPPFIPSINGSMINYDTSSEVGVNATYTIVNDIQKSVISRLLPLNLIREAYPASLDSTEPLSLFIEPINTEDEGVVIVSYIQSVFEWQYLFSDIPVKMKRNQ
jgi:hypothetical protein